MRLKSGHLLFILAAAILILGIFYRQATGLPADYRINVEQVAYVRVFSNQPGSLELMLEDKQDFESLITAYNRGVNYREARRGTSFQMEMVVELKNGDTYLIGRSSARIFWVSVETAGTSHEFKMNSRSLGKEFGLLRPQLNPS
jgi:hypothetical protein